MALAKKYLEIDGVSYPVHIVELQRKADSLDAQAYRTEDGNLHRKLIGVYMNYTCTVGIEEDMELYDRLFDKLSEPVESHMVKFPNESVALQRYFGSVQDGIMRVQDDGTIYKDLSFNCICTVPTKRAQ